MNILSILKKNPIIYAAADKQSALSAADGEADVIFLLKSDLSDLKKTVLYAHDRGKKIFIHVDLTEGLGKDESAIKFLAEYARPDGIISTKAAIIRAAKQYGLSSVFRVFLIDSQGVRTAMNAISKTDCDFVEVMPGVIPSMIKKFTSLNKNIIAGGLISSNDEVNEALSAGAIAVSTSNEQIFK